MPPGPSRPHGSRADAAATAGVVGCCGVPLPHLAAAGSPQPLLEHVTVLPAPVVARRGKMRASAAGVHPRQEHTQHSAGSKR